MTENGRWQAADRLGERTVENLLHNVKRTAIRKGRHLFESGRILPVQKFLANRILVM